MNANHDTPHPAPSSTACLKWPARLLALLMALILVSRVSAQSYTPRDIDPPYREFTAYDLNDAGQVAGAHYMGGDSEMPVVWHQGVMTQLPLPPGAVSGCALGINNNGVVVGYCVTLDANGNSTGRACVWGNGFISILLPSLSGELVSEASYINDAGTIAGQVQTQTASGSQQSDAVVWQGSTVAKLSAPAWARAIDNSGRVAVLTPAESGGQYYWSAARWTPSVPNGTTGTITTVGGPGANVLEMNNAGVMVGASGSRPALWDGSTEILLPSLSSGGMCLGINDAGDAVGYSVDENHLLIATVWDDQHAARDLNSMLNSFSDYAFPGSLLQGLKINGVGQILVWTESGYVLLSPSTAPPAPQIPEPPVDLTIHGGNNEVSISWTPANFRSGYHVKRATASGGPYATIATGVTDLSFRDTSVSNGTRYYYVVSSVAGSYESANSTEVSALPLPTPPAPVNLTATLPKAANKGVQLGWTQSTGSQLASNRVYRSANGGMYKPFVLINAGTAYTDKTAQRGVTYSYYVTAVNVNGQESPPSNAVTVRAK